MVSSIIAALGLFALITVIVFIWTVFLGDPKRMQDAYVNGYGFSAIAVFASGNYWLGISLGLLAAIIRYIQIRSAETEQVT